MKYLCATLLLFFLAGCATPQERAISAYCGAEALRTIPQQLVSQQVVRSVYIGDKIVGNRNVCKTEFVESKDKKGNITKTRETICRDNPILEPVYQQQLVNEVVDVNSSQRQLQITSCEIVSKSNGMFANMKWDSNFTCNLLHTQLLLRIKAFLTSFGKVITSKF